MKYRDILKLVERDGWRLVSEEGSHRQFRHPVKRGRVTTSLERSGAGNVEKHSATGRAQTMKYVVIYEKTSTGYSCYAPDLPGCIAAGDDLAETKGLMERAIEMHLRGMREDGDPIPKPTTAAEYLEVPAV